MSLFAVALKDPAAPPQAAAEFLSGVKDFNRDSARDFLRRHPGFLGRALALEAARELHAAACAAGLEALLADEAAMPVPPPPIRTVKIEIKGNGFYYTSAAFVDFVPFDEIKVLAAGAYDAAVRPLNTAALKADIISRIRETVLGSASAPAGLAPAKETFFRADILAGDGRRLLLESENMDFSPLGAERSPTSLTNFRTLLGKLSALAFGASKNSFLQAFLAGQQLAAYKCASPAACDEELARLILVGPGK
jgi:hypothetical protein